MKQVFSGCVPNHRGGSGILSKVASTSRPVRSYRYLSSNKDVCVGI
jgi:hypothetical protein